MSRPDRRDRDAAQPAPSRERVMRRFFEKLDAKLEEAPQPAAPPPRPAQPPATQVIATRRSPSFPPAALPLPIPPPSLAPAPTRWGPTTQESRAGGVERTGTTPSGDDSIARARAAMPLPRMPSLTLKQYVSLCMDLVLWPDERDETLRRYRVRGEGTLLLLRDHWNAKLERSAELRAEWSEAQETYRQWARKVLRM